MTLNPENRLWKTMQFKWKGHANYLEKHRRAGTFRVSKRQIFVYEKIWFSYFLIKLFYLLFAKLIFPKFTLGDTFRYLEGPEAWQGN
jgi:hypothetical protein